MKGIACDKIGLGPKIEAQDKPISTLFNDQAQ